MFAASRQSRSTRLFCRVSPNTGEVGQPLILSPCLFDLRGRKHRQRNTESRAGVIRHLRGFFCIYCIEKPAQQKERVARLSPFVSTPQAVWIACNGTGTKNPRKRRRFNTASGMDCMQLHDLELKKFNKGQFQYRKRYGLHAITTACPAHTTSSCFNTASGMDCMQYRPSQPLGQLNPEAGFLNGSLFLANRRNPAGFFCRQNRLKTSANPVIPRKLLSTGKI